MYSVNDLIFLCVFMCVVLNVFDVTNFFKACFDIQDSRYFRTKLFIRNGAFDEKRKIICVF